MRSAPATSGGRHALTVGDVLQLAELRTGAPEVVAGRAGLDAHVRWAHVSEVPNIATLLRGGELLLTTGVRLPSDGPRLGRFGADLAERGVAALIIELGTSFDVVPRALLQVADEHRLPVIALHREVAFIDVAQRINSALQSGELARLRRVDELHQRFTAAMVAGDGIPGVMRMLAGEIRNPVVLEGHDGRLLYQATYVRAPAVVIGEWDAARRGLPAAVATCSTPVPTGREQAHGTLLALAADGPLADVTQPALERAAGLIALATQQARQQEILQARARGDLLASLMSSDLSEAEIARHLTTVGFPADVSPLLPVIAVAAGAEHRHDEATWAMVWRDVREELSAQSVPVVGGLMPGADEIAFVVGMARASQRAPRADALARVFSVAARRRLGAADGVKLFVGACLASWTKVAEEMRDVAAAASFGRTGTGGGWRDTSTPDLDRLLWTLRNHPDVRAFVERRLEPIVVHDRERPVRLLPTLEAFVAQRGQKTAMARDLHLERQSVYHRIARIEKLAGCSLDDEESWLGFHLALRLLRLTDGRRPEPPPRSAR